MSLRNRLVLSFALVVVVCLSVIAAAVSVVLQGYRDRFAMAQLEDVLRPVLLDVRTLVSSQPAAADVWAGLKEQSDGSNAYILLLDETGEILRQVPPGDSPLLEVSAGQLPSRLTRYQQGTFETASGQSFIFAAQPLARVLDAQKPVAVRALVLAVPRSQSLATLLSLVRPFFYAGIVALAVSIIIAFFLARSIYRPLQRVTIAAEKMAQGEYDQEIDISGPAEVRGLATSFNRMSRQVRQAQERLRHFVADVSHQLKSPLTSIHGFAQAITDGTAADKAARTKSARIIQEESKKMMRQVDELLELSRMQSGQIKLAREPVDMEELLKQSREIFSLRAEEKGLKLTVDVPLLPQLTGDFDRLEQVFGNLLDNAIKNSPPGGEVRISARKTESAVEVSIVDSGPGIPPEQVPYVFERFYQAMGVRTGVGLGLAIAREIITAHGGDITVFSSPGEKTEFTVRLPVRP
jgi:signal transduction histidine kinase